jgi:hypothetical protein
VLNADGEILRIPGKRYGGLDKVTTPIKGWSQGATFALTREQVEQIASSKKLKVRVHYRETYDDARMGSGKLLRLFRDFWKDLSDEKKDLSDQKEGFSRRALRFLMKMIMWAAIVIGALFALGVVLIIMDLPDQ